MTILVTGGAGYVGSHTVRAMLEAGYQVVVADNLSTGFRAAVPAACRFYEGDIRDAAFLARLFEQENIDGGLVGGASLKPDFGAIVNYNK